MIPAYSVIFFTVSSGAGYGLMIWLALNAATGAWPVTPTVGLIGALAALVLITAGLLSSTFHLGHPERAWRAFTQWRSSWLSREGVLAAMTYGPAVVFTASYLTEAIDSGVAMIVAWLTALLSAGTIIATGMIYASLRPIPAWRNAWVVPGYLGLGLASGGLLAAVVFVASGALSSGVLWPVLSLLVLAWGLKIGYWRHIDALASGTDTGSATGLGYLGRVRPLESGHTAGNYVMKEMGYQIARKHAGKLRRVAVGFGVLLPALCLAGGALSAGWLEMLCVAFAAASGLLGVLVERWLFFAEAVHAVTSYYLARSAA